jgi:hypothetical protein
MQRVASVPWTHVAVFDADFEMPADFLLQTVHPLERDPRLAFVQARWTFETNAGQNLLTWAQRVGMDFHFAVEQRARAALGTFFGFNGTAGTWRRAALERSGSWSVSTTVEDMDLSLRAYLMGWRFAYLHWVCCASELPPTFSAYRTQQRRWQAGPMQVLKQLIGRVWTSRGVKLRDRLSCTYFFFRFLYSGFLTVVCLLCPAVVLWLDPWEWAAPQIAFLVAGNASAVVLVWFCGLLFWPYFLFQTAAGYFRVYAMALGLLGADKVKGWQVTKKFGGAGGGGGGGGGVRASSASATALQASLLERARRAGGAGGGGGKEALAARPSAAAALAVLDPEQQQQQDAAARGGGVSPPPSTAPPRHDRHRPYALELLCAAYFFAMAAFSAWRALYLMTSFCWIMASLFVAMSLGDYIF